MSAVGQSSGSPSTQGFPGKPARESLGKQGAASAVPPGSHPLELRQVMLPHNPQSPQVPWTWHRALTSSPRKHHAPPERWCALPVTAKPCLRSVWEWDGHFQSQHPQIQLPTSSPSLSSDTVSRVPRAQVAQSQHRLWQCQHRGAAMELLWCGQMVSK